MQVLPRYKWFTHPVSLIGEQSCFLSVAMFWVFLKSRTEKQRIHKEEMKLSKLVVIRHPFQMSNMKWNHRSLIYGLLFGNQISDVFIRNHIEASYCLQKMAFTIKTTNFANHFLLLLQNQSLKMRQFSWISVWASLWNQTIWRLTCMAIYHQLYLKRDKR